MQCRYFVEHSICFIQFTFKWFFNVYIHVYVLNLSAWKSVDGGNKFEQITTPHGDNHDLWIDPSDTTRMIEGNDGGACVSFNGGDSWSTIYNQPTSQFYHVDTDNQFPYRIYLVPFLNAHSQRR